MRFRANADRVRSADRVLAVAGFAVRSRSLAVSGLTALLLVAAGAGCARDGSDSIVVAAPEFGPGTARLRVDLAPGFLAGSFAAELDGAPVTTAFDVEGLVARAEFPLAAGEHLLVVRARFGEESAASEGRQQLRFAPPAALPDVIATQPSDDAVGVPVTAWFALDLAAEAAVAAVASLELRCGAAELPTVVTARTPMRLVVVPVADLPERANCTLLWRARAGPRGLDFETSAAASAGSVLYDRSESNPIRTSPFPDDYWLRPDPGRPERSRLEIRFADYPEPGRRLVAALLHDTRVLDGFSPIAHVTIALSEAPDPASIPTSPEQSLDPLASVALLDLTPGSDSFAARIPFRAEARSTSAWGRVSHGLLIFPSVPLASGGRYAVIVTDRVLDRQGRPFRASPFFERVRDAPPGGDDPPELLRVREILEPVFTAVAEASTPPIRRSDIALALRFTVRSTADIPNDLLAIKRDVLDGPAPEVRITSVEAGGTLSDADGGEVAAIVRGTWSVPDWREHGLTLKREAGSGRPQRASLQRLPFVLALPEAAREQPVPVVFYQHGNPGDADELIASARQSLARAGFAVMGFTDALNREPRAEGASERDQAFNQIARIMWHLLILKRIPDYFVETNAEQLSFLRAIEELARIPRFDVPAREAGAKASLHGIDPDLPVTYVGVSEGANLAPAFLAFAPEVKAAALVAGGRRFAEVLLHQEPGTILAPFAGLGITGFEPADVWVMLALFQTIFDRQDGYNFAPYLYRQPFEVAGTTRRASILLTEGLDDAAIPNHATEALARALGPIPQLLPAARRVPSLPAAGSPIVANIDAATTAALAQFVPQGIPGVAATRGCSSPPLSRRSATQGHYCVQNAPEALLQRLVFLESALREAAPSIVDPDRP